jgi:SAM-dependent methyltransferase
MAPGEQRRTACPLCGSTRLESVLDLEGRALLGCDGCGVRCTEYFGEGAAVRAYYSRVQAHHGKAFIQDDEGDALHAIAGAQADWMEGICGPRRHGSFCEVGCSRGHLLAEMEARGWEVCGIDVSETSVQEARRRSGGLIYLGEPEGAPFGANAFDRIGMFDVLAHLPWPVRSLEAVARLLKPGGELILTTVDESWPLVPMFQRMFRAFPSQTRALRTEMYEGQHYCYFGRDNIGRLLDEAGLELAGLRPLAPLSTRFFVHHYSWRRRLALVSMGRLDRLLGSSRKMLVLARKPG